MKRTGIELSSTLPGQQEEMISLHMGMADEWFGLWNITQFSEV